MKKWKKNIRSLKDSNSMVAEIIGTVLLLGIVVAIFSTLYVVVFAYPFPTSSPNVTLIGTIEGSNIIIEHHSGEALSLDTEIPITITGEKVLINGSTPTARDLLDDASKEDGVWNIGERIVYPFEYNSSCSKAEIMAVDTESNSVILVGTLGICPECDVGVKYTIDNPANDQHQLNITATNYRGDINETDVEIHITLPDGSLHIWNISNLTVGESVTRTISNIGWPPNNMNMTGIAEIISPTFPDPNLANNKAYLTYI